MKSHWTDGDAKLGNKQRTKQRYRKAVRKVESKITSQEAIVFLMIIFESTAIDHPSTIMQRLRQLLKPNTNNATGPGK